MKIKLSNLLLSLFLALGALSAAPASASVVQITVSELNPNVSDSITVTISGLEPNADYLLGHVKIVGEQKLNLMGANFDEVLVSEFTASNSGTYSWTGKYEWTSADPNLEDPIVTPSNTFMVFLDLLWSIYPSKVFVAKDDGDYLFEEDLVGMSNQMYPSTKDTLGTITYSGAGYDNGKFIPGENLEVTGSGFGSATIALYAGAFLLEREFGKTISESFWEKYAAGNISGDLWSIQELNNQFTYDTQVPALGGGEYVLWSYFMVFDFGLVQTETATLSQVRATYRIGSSFEAVATNVAGAPEFTDSEIDATMTIGEAYSAEVFATGDNVTYSIVSGSLPDGLSLNSSTGVISGTATTVGDYDFAVKAENSNGYAVVELSIEVTDSGEVQTYSRHRYVDLQSDATWFSLTLDICHVARDNRVVFTNLGDCKIRNLDDLSQERDFSVVKRGENPGSGRLTAFDVYFKPGSAKLTKKAKAKILQQVSLMKDNHVVVVGHSGRRDSRDKADAISKARMNAVSRFLHNQEVSVTFRRSVANKFNANQKAFKDRRVLIQFGNLSLN